MEVTFGSKNNKACAIIPSQNVVRQYIEDATGRRAAPIPVAHAEIGKRYWVTEDGRVFFSFPLCGRVGVSERKIERCFKFPSVRLSTGHKAEKQFSLGRLVYSAFVLGRLSEREPAHLDGDRFNCAIANLVDPAVVEEPERVQDPNTEAYRRRFNDLCWLICWRYCLRWEDAQDVAQASYLETYVGNELDDAHAANRWFVTGFNRAKDFMAKRCRLALVDYSDEANDWQCPRSWQPEINPQIVPLVAGAQARRVFAHYLEGYTPTEIGKLMGLKLGTVGCYLTRQIQRIREMLTDRVSMETMELKTKRN